MTRSLGSTRRHARVRCAIYTRKSSEEGLDQEFNSLQAQREACEAFINSQRHEGWVCLPALYAETARERVSPRYVPGIRGTPVRPALSCCEVPDRPFGFSTADLRID